jgi:hypothetical protein
VVTLDRVVCCYPDAETLLRAAAQRARKLVAFTYPRDRWYVRVFIKALKTPRLVSMHSETGMTPSSPLAKKMDSRVPGVPKDVALEAREAKFIETGPAGAERTRPP